MLLNGAGSCCVQSLLQPSFSGRYPKPLRGADLWAQEEVNKLEGIWLSEMDVTAALERSRVWVLLWALFLLG